MRIKGPRQSKILQWAVASFGEIATDPHERAVRFVEEALEVAHACGVTRAEIDKLAERAYASRSSGEEMEIGQAGMTLECLAEVLQYDLNRLINLEFNRVQRIPQEHWRARQNAKAADGLGRKAAD